MANIILSGATYTATASNHISYTNKEFSHTGGGGCNSWDSNGNCTGYADTYPVYSYPTRYTNATISGTITGETNNVSIQGKAPITVNDKGKETDTFSLPSSATTSGSGNHTNTNSGTLTGNSKNVYVNGKLLMVSGNKLTTHVSGVEATPTGSASSTVNIG